MPRLVKQLTALAVQKARPRLEAYTMASGNGLYLVIQPVGGKQWMVTSPLPQGREHIPVSMNYEQVEQHEHVDQLEHRPPTNTCSEEDARRSWSTLDAMKAAAPEFFKGLDNSDERVEQLEHVDQHEQPAIEEEHDGESVSSPGDIFARRPNESDDDFKKRCGEMTYAALKARVSRGASSLTAIAKAQADLDELIYQALKPAMEDVEVLGYPGLHDPQQFHFRTRIQTADLLAHSTAVQYRIDKTALDESLPEHSIGLGYQNLQSLSFMLVSFRAARLNPSQGAPAAVHLVLVEEPEAHLHVQVQRNFSSNALGLIRPKEAIHSKLRSQLLISTHSSHLAHGDSFTRLRYVKRLPGKLAGAKPSTEIVNLGVRRRCSVSTALSLGCSGLSGTSSWC